MLLLESLSGDQEKFFILIMLACVSFTFNVRFIYKPLTNNNHIFLPTFHHCLDQFAETKSRRRYDNEEAR